MEEPFPDVSGDAANEGTAAHELAAHCLANDKDPAHYKGRVVDITATTVALRFLQPASPLGNDGTRWPVTDEMIEGVNVYLEHVRGLRGERAVEQRLDISHVADGIFGTGDALVYDQVNKHLHVIDLKYGRGVLVEAKDNPQLLLYASGAAKRYHNREGINLVTMTIVQPRAQHPKGPVRSHTITWKELADAETEIGEGAKRVAEASTAPDVKPYLSSGSWCRFCKAGAVCEVRAEEAIAAAEAEFTDLTAEAVSAMPPEKLAKVLAKARDIEHWIKAVQEHAHAEAMAGRPVPGFKLVEKRAVRKWRNEQLLIENAPMMLSIPEDALYGPRPLLSPAQLEKILSPAERKDVAPFVVKSSSGFNLVPEDDPRPAAKPSAEDEFGPVGLDDCET